MIEARDSSPHGGGRPSRVILVDAAFDDARAGHHWRLNKGYADLLGWERTWIAASRSLTSAPGIPADRLLGVFGASHYDAGERQRHGRVGRALQALAYRDDTGAPAWLRRLIQTGLARRRRTSPLAPPRRRASHSSLYSDELSALVAREGLGPDDHLVFTSLDPEMGRAILDLLVRRGSAALPAMHLRLMYDDATATVSPLDYEGLIERLVASGEIGSRLSLHAETAHHAEGLSRRTGHAIGVAPFPAAELPPPPPAGDRRLVIGYLGEARIEKGFDRLEPIMDAFAARHPELVDRVVWRIHAGGRTIEAARQRDRVRLARRSETMLVERRFGSVDPQAYESLRASIDIVLAPQDPAVYGERGSGIAQEAVAGGRPLVCLADSSLAREDGAVLSGATNEDLADALARVVAEPQAYFDLAALRARSFSSRLADSNLVRICTAPLARGVDRALALMIQDGPGVETAAPARALTSLGYQVVRLHLVNTGSSREEVLSAAMRGTGRDRDTMLSLAADPQADPDPAVEDLCRSGRVGLLLALGETAERWSQRLPLDPAVARVLAADYGPAALEAEWRSRLEVLAGDASRPRANRV